MSGYKDYGYDDTLITHNFLYTQDALLAILDKSKNTCILDVGCGNGYLANYLLTLGFNIYGTDASAEGILMARKQNPDRFFIQDLSSDKLPVELQGLKFDTILATEVIEHLYDPENFITFCKQALEPGGEIIITTPYHGYLKNLVLSLFDKWDTHQSPLWLGGHIKMWSADTLGKLLMQAGFTVTNFKGCGRIPYLWKSMIIKARLH